MLNPNQVDPIFSMREAEQETGETAKTLRRRAKEKPPRIQIIKLSDRRHGIRKSVLDAYNASKEVVGCIDK